MRADWTFRPQMGLDIGKSGFLIVKVRGGQNGIGHRKSPMASTLYLAYGTVKCNVAKRMRSEFRTARDLALPGS